MVKKFKMNPPQAIILAYLAVLLLAVKYIGLPLTDVFNESLVKWAMNGILVLSLVPMINVGAGRNFGLSIGISAGLIGMLVAIEFRLESWAGFYISILVASLVALVFGFFYSLILNRLKGNEEIVATFAGYSFISLMNIFWTVAPFTNRQMLYPIGGKGLRPKISMNEYFLHVLDGWMNVELGPIKIPLGLLGFFFFLALLVHALSKSRLGYSMKMIAENETFASLSGVHVSKHRTYAIILSTVIAAIGIIVYSQSYGFVHLYDGPLMMTFPAISAIVIGGASRKRATVFHALLGSYLYQTSYLLSVPIANALLIPEMSELVRMVVTNSIILYAFLYEGVLKKNEKA